MEVWSSENPHPNLATNARLEWGTRRYDDINPTAHTHLVRRKGIQKKQ